MEEQTLKNILSQSPLFKTIFEGGINQFIQNYNYKIETFDKQDVIALMGDACNHLLIVLEGNVIARMVSDSGKFIQIEKMGVGRILAPAMLFATENKFPVNVVPEGKVVLLKMSKQEFLRAMQGNERLLFNFIQIVSDVNKFLSDKIHFLSLMSLRGKLAQYFLGLSEIQKNDKEIIIPMTRQELADKFGVSRQSLIRSLTELEEANLIVVDKRTIKLLDRFGLDNEE